MYPPELKTERLVIKAYRPEDEERFVEMALDELCIKFMGGATGLESDVRKLFNSGFEIYKRKDERWFWLWGIYKNDLLCGHLELKQTESTNENELEVIYMMHPDSRRMGIMFEALSLLKQNQKTWQKKVIATVSMENTNSLFLLRKIGLEKEEIIIREEPETNSLKLIFAE